MIQNSIGLAGTGGTCYDRDAQIPAREIELLFSKESALLSDMNTVKRLQLYDVWLWKKFVELFRHPGVDDMRIRTARNGWRSEYWGKMMRGAAIVCRVTGDEDLYAILTDSVKDLLTVADERGRISTYSLEKEFDGWDMWGRKYVLLGLQYYLEICRDAALAEQILQAMCRHADYIMEFVGDGEGKRGINTTTRHWGGLNSSSILEPYVRLYRLTGERKYLDFAEYIIREGGTTDENVFETAFEDKKAPYQYAYVKAYEMMSCFEGLIEYSRTVNSEHYRRAAIRFGYKILETDVTVIGCCGCTHELFDHSRKMQTQPAGAEIMQETCVTVTWMKLCAQLLRLTGDPVFADAMEQSYCNAYLGALNTRGVVKTEMNLVNDENAPIDRVIPSYVLMPFDSYSPLTADSRGRKIGGKCIFFDDNTYYGCCACIGAAGVGILGEMAATRSEDGLTLNYYFDGDVALRDGESRLSVRTAYPYGTTVEITVDQWSEQDGLLRLRIPAWSAKTELTLDGEPIAVGTGYVAVTVRTGSRILLRLDGRVRRILPPCEDGPDASLYEAFALGPVILAKDLRLCDNLFESSAVAVDSEGYTTCEIATDAFEEIPDARLSVLLQRENGEMLRLVDYSSAGNTLTPESACAAWLYR